MISPASTESLAYLSDALPTTLCAAFWRTVDRDGDRVALRTVDGSVSWTWSQYAERMVAVARAFHSRGVRRGRTVAIMIDNHPAFHVVDTAALQLGAIPFSIYATAAPRQIAFLLGDADPALIVCDAHHLPALLEAGVDRQQVIVLGEDPDDRLADLVAAGASETLDVRATSEQADPGDVVTLIYTSGTTGEPKGVQLTHRNVLATTRGLDRVVGFRPHADVLSYLPLAHVAERNNSHWFAMCLGFRVTSCPEPRRVAEYLPQVRPIWFFGVPRIFEKMQTSVMANAGPERRAAVQEALARLERGEAPDRDDPELAAIRREVGLDEAAAVNVGSAPAVHEMLRFFHAIGIPLAELWGMSECSGGTVNPGNAIKMGTVGPPVFGLEARIADDGELQVRGQGVSIGYWKRPDLTAAAFTDDGWLHSGDIGEIDEDGYVSIVGRRKEIIISAGGKNMSPAAIEEQVKGRCLLVGQVVAIGDRRPYVVALVTLDAEAARAFAREHGLGDRTIDELADDPIVLAEIERAVGEANAQLARVEQIKRYRVLGDQWEPGSALLTPTMKLRRPQIAERYADVIDALYAG